MYAGGRGLNGPLRPCALTPVSTPVNACLDARLVL